MSKTRTSNGKKGGLLEGKPHYDKDGDSLGGIKAVVTDAGGKPVELEGGEVIINKEASKKYWKELSKINQSAGNGVPILPPDGAVTDEDPEEFSEGGNIIEFNPNHLPNKWITEYAKQIKRDHPEIWKKGGNIFGNEAFVNLCRVRERGHWLDSEEWMYIKWRSYVARHKKDFRIEGVVAMLKWCDKVDKGWGYMKTLIEKEIANLEKKKKPSAFRQAIKEKSLFKDGGKVSKTKDSCQVLDKNGNPAIDDKSLRKMEKCIMKLTQTKDMNLNANGKYKLARRKLHKKIIDEFKKNAVCITEGQPIAILMGGSPASGKSSFLRKYRPFLLQEEILKVDADEIRAKLPEYKGYNATQTHQETKDIVTTLISDRNIGVPCDFDLIYDGTMNNVRSYKPLIELLRSRNYKIFIVYMDKVPKEVIMQRMKDRYLKTGRFVPAEVVDDFFKKGTSAFEELKPLVDGYLVIDGSNQDYNIIEKGGIQLPEDRAYSKLGQKISAEELEKIEYKRGGNLDKIDSVELDIPLLIRVLEFAREDIKSDPELHHVVERLIEIRDKGVLTMEDYDFIADLKKKEKFSEIERKYANGGAILLAHNGNRSNLTPEQHKLVRTPEFKAWFGDWENDPKKASKVVDENGEPLVCFHGTNSNFTVFKTKKRLDSINNPLYESGLWFFAPSFDKQISEDERNYSYEKGNAEYMAETFMGNKDDKGNYIENKVIKVFLNVRNPKIIDGVTDRQAEELKYYSQEMRKLKNNDAIIMHGSLTDGNMFRDDINVLNANQIKLADGTNTTFDPNNDDIRFEDGGEIKLAYATSIIDKDSLNINHIFDNGFFSEIFGEPRIFLIEENKIIGCLFLNDKIFFAETSDYEFDIVIKENKRGKGYSKLLLDEMIKDFVLNFKKSKYIEANVVNEELSKYLVRKYGFSCEEAEWSGYIENYCSLSRKKAIQYLKNNKNNNQDTFRRGGRTTAQTPAPSKERIYGSEKNKPRSSKDSSSAETIKFDEKTLASIENKLKEHNESHPDVKVNLATAKAVVRRGMGAYSKSHRPTISGGKPNSRVAWGLARLNAFLYKAVHGVSKSGKYSQDNDLLDELGIAHKKFADGGTTEGGEVQLNSYREFNEYADKLPKFGYHGTQSATLINPRPSKEGRYGEGLYLTLNPNTAEYFGKFTKTSQGYSEENKSANVFEFDLQGLNLKYFKKAEDMPYIDFDGLRQKNYDGIYLDNEGEIVIFNIHKLPNGKLVRTLNGTKVDGNNPNIRFKTGGEIPKKKKNGNCYEKAGKMILYANTKPYTKIDYIGKPYLVHAQVTGQGAIEGVKYGHAWIEDDAFVYDYSNKRELKVPKALYYQIGQIIEQQPIHFKYTFEEARRKMNEIGHYGSWDLITESEL